MAIPSGRKPPETDSDSSGILATLTALKIISPYDNGSNFTAEQFSHTILEYKTTMEYRSLGLSGLRVSAVSLGCMGMSHGYGLPADRLQMSMLLADCDATRICTAGSLRMSSSRSQTHFITLFAFSKSSA